MDTNDDLIDMNQHTARNDSYENTLGDDESIALRNYLDAKVIAPKGEP